MVAVVVTILAGVLSSLLLLSSVVVALIKYHYHLLYQPLFLSFSYVSCCFISIYPTTVFEGTTMEIKLISFFVLSLPSHLMENFSNTVFNFKEFLFVYVVNVRFICDGKIYLLTYKIRILN